MARKMLIALLAILASGLALSGCGGGEETAADQFTADIKQTAGGLTTVGKFYARAGDYRMDLEEGGQPLTVMVDHLKAVTTISAPLEKMYTEIPIDHPASVTNDPFQGLNYALEVGETQLESTETVEGYQCDRSVILADGQKVMTQWVARKLNFPIKIVMHGRTEKMVELVNIQEVAVADSLFRTPDDYARFDMPGGEPAEAPEWAAGIPSAPLLTPPFERDVTAGDIVRVKTVAGKSLTVKASCVGEGECTAKAIPFKGGLPLREINTYNNFAVPGTICERRHETTAEADEIVIRIDEGDIKLVAKWLPMHEKRLKAGEEFSVPLVPGQNIEDVRFVNLNDGESSLSWDYYSEGNLLAADIVGPEEYRTRDLRAKNESQRSVWKPFGDEIIVRVDSGEVLVKLGQYDPFKF